MIPEHKRSEPAERVADSSPSAGSVLVGEVSIAFCDVCGGGSNVWAEDEDDRIWCGECMNKWERKHNADWGTGKPNTKGQA